MNLKVIAYWVTTLFAAFELLAGGATDLIRGSTGLVVGEPVADVLAHLGYPAYLLTILGLCKLLGGAALLVPLLSHWDRGQENWDFAERR
jgi:DoxX-like family